jgi:hypothetical protein
MNQEKISFYDFREYLPKLSVLEFIFVLFILILVPMAAIWSLLTSIFPIGDRGRLFFENKLKFLRRPWKFVMVCSTLGNKRLERPSKICTDCPQRELSVKERASNSLFRNESICNTCDKNRAAFIAWLQDEPKIPVLSETIVGD